MMVITLVMSHMLTSLVLIPFSSSYLSLAHPSIHPFVHISSLLLVSHGYHDVMVDPVKRSRKVESPLVLVVMTTRGKSLVDVDLHLLQNIDGGMEIRVCANG